MQNKSDSSSNVGNLSNLFSTVEMCVCVCECFSTVNTVVYFERNLTLFIYDNFKCHNGIVSQSHKQEKFMISVGFFSLFLVFLK